MIHVIADDKKRNIQAPDCITVNGVPHYFVMYNNETDTFVVSIGFFTEGYNIPADGNWNLDDEIPSYIYNRSETMKTLTHQTLLNEIAHYKRVVADQMDIHAYYQQSTESLINNLRNANAQLCEDIAQLEAEQEANNDTFEAIQGENDRMMEQQTRLHNDIMTVMRELDALRARNAYLEIENEHFPDEIDALKYQIMQLEAKLEDNSETPSSQ